MLAEPGGRLDVAAQEEHVALRPQALVGERPLEARPASRPDRRELNAYNYFRRNVAGVQREWWFHRSGCRAWFIAERDTTMQYGVEEGAKSGFERVDAVLQRLALDA